MNAEQRRARREFVRLAHPDAGGDPEVFRLGMAAIDGPAPRDAQDGGARPPAAGSRLAAAALGRAARLAREWATLPREVKDAYREGRGGDDGPDDNDRPGRDHEPGSPAGSA